MSNTYKHKILSMYRNGTLDYWEDEAPLHIQRKWDRDNLDIGECRKERKDKQIRDLDKQLEFDLNE